MSYGDDFITAFPENIAFFYPSDLRNVLRVTALHDNTKIKVFYKTTQKDLDIYLAGQTQIVHISDSSEVNQLGISNTAVRITSDKKSQWFL